MKIVILLLFILNAYESQGGYDYIIVGSGPSGAALANRLSTNPNVFVLLLEAGERPNLLTEVPSYYFYLYGSSYDWNYNVIFPDFPNMEKRAPVHLPHGKGLGGESLINSMLYIRGNRKDFDNWEKKGACGWGWREIFPLFRRSERNLDDDIANNGYHGTNGEMFVQRPAFITHLASKYLQAAQELGFRLGDVNGENQSVFSIPQIISKDGRRWGVDKAFLYPIEGRWNLNIATNALVRKIIIRNKVAVGVEYDFDGVKRRAMANQEVILSAGAIRSPQLLMLSGIGPIKELSKVRIPVIKNLPVGKNLHDHSVFSLPLYKVDNLKVSEKDYKEFLERGKGILSISPTEVVGFFSTIYNEDYDWPDAEIVLVTLPSSVFSSAWDQGRATVICANMVQRPKSRGRLTLRDRDPRTPPLIAGMYLYKEEDANVLVEGIKMCLKLGDTQALRGIGDRIPPPSLPACNNYSAASDEYYRCLGRQLATPGYHVVGTCKMGDPKDNTTVVDFDLKVKGIKGLRVADSSIAPEVITGCTFALDVLIGEKAADLIFRDYYAEMGNAKNPFTK
ncbi:glucose dehydrogenase [FAD, quinone]-like [Centruroides vittatus]|uniref:glucose dehydrogenase [FAD, quinone]-like n=1 Tax=Centruroides vittatus TaxID=120091 RepID=UPI00350EDD38